MFAISDSSPSYWDDCQRFLYIKIFNLKEFSNEKYCINKKVEYIQLKYREADSDSFISIGKINAVDNTAVFNFDTSLTSGNTIELCAVAWDKSQNESEFVLKTVTVDRTGPGKPVIGSVTASSTVISIKWDDFNVDDYSHVIIELSDDAGATFKNVAKVTKVLGANIEKLNPSTDYVIRLRAYDIFGNPGTVSDDIEITTSTDSISPVITKIEPDKTVYNSDIEISVEAVDNYGISNISLYYSNDKENWVEADSKSYTGTSKATLTYTFNSASLNDGIIYIKATATDVDGNISDEALTAKKLDRIAPNRITNLNCNTDDGYVKLLWNTQDEDIEYYKVYRKKASDDSYSPIEEHCNTIGYYDVTTDSGVQYKYCIYAVDEAGNVSNKSNELTVTAPDDDISPVIYGMSVEEGDVIGINPKIDVVIYDSNNQSVMLEYGQDDIWTQIGTMDVTELLAKAEFKWNTKYLESGNYTLRATATDRYGNISEKYSVDIVLDLDAPVAGNLTCIGGSFENELTWEAAQCEDIDYYTVYRKGTDDTEFKSIENTTSVNYIDKKVVPGVRYEYYVTYTDKAGNSSESNIEYAIADNTDNIAPVVNTAEYVRAVAGIGTAFDGSLSTDNVRIASYVWNMGNGAVLTGARPAYAYNRTGIYTATLTVTDDAGNSDSMNFTVEVIDPQSTGRYTIQVTDIKGKPVSDAYIYIYGDEGKSYRTDSLGMVTLYEELGVYKIAVYRQGYLPTESTFNIESAYDEEIHGIALESGEVVTGVLDFHRMNILEMLQEGIDVTSPVNYNSYAVTIKFKYLQGKPPIEIVFNVSGDGKKKRKEVNNGGIDVDSKDWEGTSFDFKIVDVEGVDTEPVYVYLTTMARISWLKDIYEVNLGVINNAEPQFVMTDCSACLNMDDDLDFAAMKEGNQDAYVEMKDIAGGQSDCATWFVTSSKSGEYEISADFHSILTPFNVPVNFNFKAKDKMKIETGEGLVLRIFPEKTAYPGMDYYVRFSLANTSDRTLYNVSVDFSGSFSAPKATELAPCAATKPLPVATPVPLAGEGMDYHVTKARKGMGGPVVRPRSHLSVGVFGPHQSISGLYETTLNTGEDPEEICYNLVDYIVDELGDTKGVKLEVIPVSSHVFIPLEEDWGKDIEAADPVNVTTGAFTDNLTAMAINGSTGITFGIEYNSLDEESGAMGEGWHNTFESRIEQDGRVTDVYITPDNKISFITQDTALGIINGRVSGNTLILEDEEESIYHGDYVCINGTIKGYELKGNSDNTYTFTFPSGQKNTYDHSGRLIGVKGEDSGRAVITYGTDNMTITDPVTGRYITAIKNSEGLITQLNDYAGRSVFFTYTDGLMTAFTNALGESIYYDYDSNGRIIEESDSNHVTYVKNEYDDEGRVIVQDDGIDDSNFTYFDYSEDEYSTLTTVMTDRNGNDVTYVSDGMGHLVSVTDKRGNTTLNEYDKNGNNTKMTDACGGTTNYTYDDKGNVIYITDSRRYVTQMEYDSRGNVIKTKTPGAGEFVYSYNSDKKVTSYTDNMDVTRTYEYDENGHVTKEAVEGLGQIRYTYTNGILTCVTDMAGQDTKYYYDEYGNVKKEEYADGTYTAYEYDALGRQTVMYDEAGNSISYTYDVRGNVTSVTDKAGNTQYNEYDGNNRLTKTTDMLGNITRYEYDAEGNNVRITYPDNSYDTMEHDECGNMTSVTDSDGNTTSYTYDGLGRVSSMTTPEGNTTTYTYVMGDDYDTVTYPDGSQVTYTYDSQMNVTSTTNSTGAVTRYVYDNGGNLNSITDALGHAVDYRYDKYSRLIQYTDANGNDTHYTYDAKGRCVCITTPDGTRKLTTYDSRDRVTKVSIPRGEGEEDDITVTYNYDVLSRVTSYTDADGNTFSTTYDVNGNITAVTDADGNTITMNEYDELSRLVKSRDALGIYDTYTYDSMGRLTTGIDNTSTPKEQTTSYAYDAIGRLISVNDACNGTSSQTYDNDGNVISVTDPNGGVSSYAYDNMGRVQSYTDALSNTKTYTYNSQGLTDTVTDRSGKTTQYTYDAVGQITSKTDELGTISYTYDYNGNILTVTDANGTITREYDNMDRVSKYTDYRGNTVSYSYDELGNLISLTYPGGEIVRYEYYPGGRLKKVTDNEGRITSYEYDGNGRLVKTSRADGSVETYTYDLNGQLLSQHDTCNGENIQTISYTYDEAGNVVNISTFIGKDKTNTDNGCMQVTGATMTYNEMNQLITYNGHNVTYDTNGNMTYGPLNGEMTTFTYDCRNRLVSAGTTSYEYDAEDNRIAVITPDTRTDYVVENNATNHSQILISTVTDLSDTSATPVATHYVYGNGLITQNSDKTGLWVYHYNNVGSTTAITDADGKILYNYDYSTYGELLSGDAGATPFLYNGKLGVMTDSNGLYYMRARYYNPGIKRFINQDIVTGDITVSPSLNQYSYVQGNPVSLTDPFGLCPIIDWTSIGHLTLDVLSVIPIPVFSDACSLVNAAWYYKEGNKTEAIAHMIGSMSLVGDVIGAGLKACRLTKAAKVIKYTTRIADATANTVIAGSHLSESVTSFMDSVEKGHPSFKDFCKSVCYGFMFGMAASSLGANISAVHKDIKAGREAKKIARDNAARLNGGGNGTTFEGTIYRSVNKQYDPLEMSQYTINSNHRYTEKGVPGLYFSSGEKIVKAELGNYDVTDFSNRIMYSYDVKLTNMLDVSNPSIRKKLGVSLDSIVGESYDVTHAIGRYAYSNGYNGIIAPSARADGGVNIILFNTKEVK